MRAILSLLFAAIVLPLVPASIAQSNREAAVAIDQVAIPPADTIGLDRLTGGLRRPWSMTFLPDGRLLLVEKHDGLRVWDPRAGLGPVVNGGPPNVLTEADSGYLDIALDPAFATNSLIYLAYAEGSAAENRTAIWRARWDGTALQEGRTIFRVNAPKKGPAHPGGRLLFLPDATFLLSVGDGFDFKDMAQDMRSHLGKILRLSREGGVPADNPYVGKPEIAPEIWSSGHRNVQGLTRDPADGSIWASDHGPRGGDRVSKVTAGSNHGWPRITHGLDYDGKLISRQHSDPAFAVPQMVWVPSIAPSGLAIYRGTAFPDWDGKVLSGGLASRALHRMRIGRETGLMVEEARMFAPLRARIRDVRVGPAGDVYLLTDDPANGQLLRLASQNETAAEATLLSPLLFLRGNWVGDSRFLSASIPSSPPVDAVSATLCALAVQNRYLRCTTDFTRPNGRRRVVEHSIQPSADGTGFDVLVLNGNAPGQSRYLMRWNADAAAFEAMVPTEQDGQAATERVRLTPSADQNALVHTEELRLNGADTEAWRQTFRWSWRRAP